MEHLQWGNAPDTLNGMRVLDLTRLLPGPFCTMLLADLGAEVIKIEEPDRGDYLRWMPPHLNSSQPDKSAAFASLNRGKSSLSLNLKSDEGKAIFLKLAAQSDVIIESFRPGVMTRLGLGPEALCKENERLIYCAISGYGQTGPYRERAGHDLNYLAASGVLQQNGSGPMNHTIPGFQLADIAGGSLYAVISILAAIVSRDKNGRGALLDISMTDGAATFLAPLFARLAAGEPLPLTGRDQLTGGLPCYQIYRTKDDKHVTLAALEPHFWETFCRIVNRPDWSTRGHSQSPEMHSELSALFASRPLSHWRQIGIENDICLEPVRSPEEAVNSTLSQARAWFLNEGAETPFASLHTATPVTPRNRDVMFREAPSLGQDTRRILLSLDYNDEEIEALSTSGHIKLVSS